MDIFLNKVIQFYLNNTINLRHLSQRTLYPQNGDRIVTIDSVTLFHPMYKIFASTTSQPRRLVCGGGRVIPRYRPPLAAVTPVSRRGVTRMIASSVERTRHIASRTGRGRCLPRSPPEPPATYMISVRAMQVVCPRLDLTVAPTSGVSECADIYPSCDSLLKEPSRPPACCVFVDLHE